MGSHQSSFYVFERTEGVVAVRPIVITKNHMFVPFTRIAVDTSKEEVFPRVLKCGATDFWLNMFDRQVGLDLSLAVAAVVADSVL